MEINEANFEVPLLSTNFSKNYHSKSNLTLIPAICDPVCLNGGDCVEPNICSCASGYKGDVCDEGLLYDFCIKAKLVVF